VVGFEHMALEKVPKRDDFASFYSAWENISTRDSTIYIISWDQYFFILKDESEAYYIIDTIGSRLEEENKQAFIYLT